MHNLGACGPLAVRGQVCINWNLLDCRDPKIAVTMLKSLVPEFEHGRDNDNLEKAS
tara:strand:- start:82 stop:249 length:168 start_codon:yes stop_codon:yes gene_type:complete